MADIKVDIPQLGEFRNTVNTSGQQFDQIKQNLDAHLKQLRAQEWETEGARDFDAVFETSKVDIDNLVRTMHEFVRYLDDKIGKAQRVDSHKTQR